MNTFQHIHFRHSWLHPSLEKIVKGKFVCDNLNEILILEMACCSGEEESVLKTGPGGIAVLGESVTTKETVSANSSIGDSGDTSVLENNAIKDARNTLELQIPAVDDVPDAKPSADPSEVDAKPLGYDQ